ncbi:hypothetical protein PQC07_gp261 [Aeromonas phage D3]|uniref:Uncharacterized protein n=2 Tax=Ludhianavirus TaxID=3044751 RepID=A0A514TVI2_9CAUD|nr:hypothetical protein PQC07_gp261 [Aeromonas phage D3]YP_010668763.1 hypothetical protein PQC08_gp260 [Aeromonas phage D6]QDJ97013.1 hypothetical protein D3_0014 [Aeromonas phage D3]QDJ97175.1 hypothetical protein D6_0015 [Aeromonas phage D6]QEP52319.1 hypothetical protein D9_0112 [Aeromonas phage D9]
MRTLRKETSDHIKAGLDKADHGHDYHFQIMGHQWRLKKWFGEIRLCKVATNPSGMEITSFACYSGKGYKQYRENVISGFTNHVARIQGF